MDNHFLRMELKRLVYRVLETSCPRIKYRIEFSVRLASTFVTSVQTLHILAIDGNERSTVYFTISPHAQ